MVMILCLCYPVIAKKCPSFNVAIKITKYELKETKNCNPNKLLLTLCLLVFFYPDFCKNSRFSRCVFENEQHSKLFKFIISKKKFP